MPLLLLSLFAPPALAADGLDAHGFHLAGLEADLRAPLLVTRPSSAGQWGFYAGGLFEYAAAPVVLNNGNVREPLLDNIFALDLSAGISLAPFLRVDAALPVYLASEGVGGDPIGVAPGDARLAVLGTIVAPDASKPVSFGLALRPHLDLPTGDSAAYLGVGELAGGGVVAASVEGGGFSVVLDAGAQLNPEVDLYNLGSRPQVLLGGAFGCQLSDLVGVVIESRSALSLADNAQPGTDSPTEITGSLRVRNRGGFQLIAGGAFAVTDAVGAAQYRVFVGGGFGSPGQAKVVAPVDSDGDGLLGDADKCPTEPEVQNGYRDDDGCPDTLTSVVVEAHRGAMLARQATISVVDEGGVERGNGQASVQIDKVVPGTKLKAEATGRCARGEAEFVATASPATFVVQVEPHWGSVVRVSAIDEKGATVPNAEVSWGEEVGPCAPPMTKLLSGTGPVNVGAGHYSIFVTAPGYTTDIQEVTVDEGGTVEVVAKLKPSKVQVTDSEVVILDKVYFETGKADIKSESFALLDEVARTIQRAQIRRLEVAGHTDDVGNDADNLALSQARADSVRTYLIRSGVAADRLVAKGYGESKPVVAATDATARAKNRRVEFKILEKARSAEE